MFSLIIGLDEKYSWSEVELKLSTIKKNYYRTYTFFKYIGITRTVEYTCHTSYSINRMYFNDRMVIFFLFLIKRQYTRTRFTREVISVTDKKLTYESHDKGSRP